MLPVKKIYIDSRHRTPDSVDASNFKYELPILYSFRITLSSSSLTYAFLMFSD